MPKGIRNIEVESGSESNSCVEVVFGPHHRVTIEEDDEGVVTFELVSTHHGFEAEVSEELPTELEEMINAVREEFPEHTVD